MGNNDILLDENSAISIEEQNEILTRINGITEQNRVLLSQNEGGKNNKIKAKKSGAFFPLSVNIAAVIIIAAGTFFLVSFNLGIDARARTGGAVYNLTERALIEEIRKDTAEKLAAKDREISNISTRLGEVDTQLLFLQSVIEMTSEQADTRETLLGLQQVYRGDLSLLREERAKILDESRLNEAVIRAKLEERTKEFASQQTTADGLSPAVIEFQALASEQNKIAAIDAQITGGFALLADIIQDGQYDHALSSLENLRGFNNSNSLSSSTSFQARKEFYNQSINSMEALVVYLRNFSYLNNAGILLGEKNARLEQDNEELRAAIDALNSGSDSQAGVFAELQESVSTLRATVSSLETSSAVKDRTIASLQAAGTEKDASLQAMQAASAEKDRLTASLETNAAEKDRTISTLETNIAERNRTITSLENERTQLNQNLANLQARSAAQEQEINNLNNQIQTIRSLLN